MVSQVFKPTLLAQLSQAKLYNMMTYDGKWRCLRVAI